ncbi:MAG TPA: type II toxin-antitoxin system VapB family antitoxin [Candidatus Hydrogenedentes bacterium]|nr:type II toxin-antitoxin system VapB family antitoxin [Candidatus Hydrogenedentota bacterium]
MRTTVVIDDTLLNKALELGGFSTKKSAIEAGLHLLIQRHAQQQLRLVRGKIAWEGDLAESRRD